MISFQIEVHLYMYCIERVYRNTYILYPELHASSHPCLYDKRMSTIDMPWSYLDDTGMSVQKNPDDCNIHHNIPSNIVITGNMILLAISFTSLPYQYI